MAAAPSMHRDAPDDEQIQRQHITTQPHYKNAMGILDGSPHPDAMRYVD